MKPSPEEIPSKSFGIIDLLKLNPEQLNRTKMAFEVAMLARDAEEKKKEGPLQKLAPHLTPIAAFTGIILSIGTILSLVWNSYETRTESEEKYFNDLVQSASESDNGTGQRIAGIFLLKQYWGRAKYEVVLANALSGMLAHENDEGILDACAEAIGNAYKADTPSWERERIRTILYGDIKGNVGALMRNQKILIAQNKLVASPCYDMRIRYFGEAVRKNWVDLEYVYLPLAELPGIHLYQAHLKGAILEGANLSGPGAQLFGSDFADADLQKARMANADARGADFKSAKLQSARLSGADLSPLQDEKRVWYFTNFADAHLESALLDEKVDARGAGFRTAHMHGALLVGANLVPFKDDEGHWHFTSFMDADLSGADLIDIEASGANFERANVSYADLICAKIGTYTYASEPPQHANFERAILKDANIISANLRGADLRHTDLTGADFTDSDLQGVDLEGAILLDTNFQGANLGGAKFTSAAALQHVKGEWKGKPIYP